MATSTRSGPLLMPGQAAALLQQQQQQRLLLMQQQQQQQMLQQSSALLPAQPRLYNTRKYRRGNYVHIPKRTLAAVAKDPVRLVPIRLEFEIDGNKVQDNFTWNLNETVVTPEIFAQLLVEDICGGSKQMAQSAALQIAQSIRKQCESWQAAVNESEDLQPSAVPEKEPATDESDVRTIIKLDIQVGDMQLRDQFEWPLDPCTPHADDSSVDKPVQHPTPESFARQLCADLSLGSEFVSMVAHSIREQLYQARLNPMEAQRLGELESPPVRPTDRKGGWTAQVLELTSREMDDKDKEQERERRRLRRSQRSATTVSTAIQITGVGALDPSDMNRGLRPGILPPDSYSPYRRMLPAVAGSAPPANRFNPYTLGGTAIPGSAPRPYPGQFPLLPQQHPGPPIMKRG